MGNLSDSRRNWEDLEIDLLLEAVYQRHGIDFRGHERARLKQKLQCFLQVHGIATFSALQDKIMHEQEVGERFLCHMGERKGHLFDDPQCLHHLREFTMPWLRSHPAPRIWLAECVAPEDVCALAILLDEEGLGGKAQIFATASNESLLRQAATCGMDRSRLDIAAAAHLAGGGEAFAQHFQVSPERAILAPRLRANITWAQFQLQTDASFNEFHLILCRSVLPEFGLPLQGRILELFHDSLSMFGQLLIDADTELRPAPFSSWFRPLVPDCSLHKRVT